MVSGVSPPGPPVPSGLRRRYLRVPAERGIHRAGRYFRSCVLVGVGVGRVLLSDGRRLHSTPPGEAGAGRPGGCRGGGPGTVPGWASSGESGVPDLAVPGTGVMDGRRRFHSSGAPVRSRTCPAGPSTAFRLSFTAGRGGRLRFISSVPSPGIAGRQPGTGLSPGPPTVSTNALDHILPSLAQMAPRRHSP